jgi:hypothetical protein
LGINQETLGNFEISTTITPFENKELKGVKRIECGASIGIFLL